MNLQVIMVSVNYADFLCHVLEENKNLFNKWVIVTDTKDQKTKELCEKYAKHNVICLQTDVFYANGAKFNKFAGINEGLKLIDQDAWTLFLDSDIVLHPHTRRVLENLNLNKEFLYGIDRANCKGRENWETYKKKRNLIHNNWLMAMDHSIFEFGARLIHLYGHEGDNGKFAGWNPLGFFQLAHRSAFKEYPQNSQGADHCDIVFARLWSRDKRQLIPEILAIHIESKFAVKATNWYGRVSLPFEREKEKLSFSYICKISLRILYIRFNILKRKYFTW
jgi:hypothetical protein